MNLFRYLYVAFCRIYQSIIYFLMKFYKWDPPETIEGADSILQVPEFLQKKGLKKPLIVTDKGITKVGLCDKLKTKLKETNIPYEYFDDTQPNPVIKNIEDAKKKYEESGCDSIIAVGGGSAIDTAKIAACRIARPRTPVKWLSGVLGVIVKLPPVIAIPTTAGTGSETTIVAVVVDPDTHHKFALIDPTIRPFCAVLDPCLTLSLPKHITSTTGMDALTHSVEAYIGNSNCKQTIADAEKSVKLIFENLEKVYENGDDLFGRMKMLQASYFGGLAFTHAFIGNVHAIAHALGGLYNVPHGLANAIILPYVLEYYGVLIYDKLARLSDIVGLKDENEPVEVKAKAFINEIREMNRRMNIPEKFECIKEGDIGVLVKRVVKEANPLYPVPKIMDDKDCEEIIRKISSNL